MGLDQFAYTRDAEGEQIEELKYWRKHNALHGWMEMLYRIKGGGASMFNGVEVELDFAAIEQLEKCVSEGNLPHTEGFFSGADSSGDDESSIYLREETLEFVAKAKKALARGEKVYYDSSW